VGTKDVPGDGKGGSFKRERADTRTQQSTGTCAELDRYGSMGHCIESVLRAGAFISFSRTRDGGATLIRVLSGTDKLSSYCHNHSEVMEAMEALEQEFRREGLTLLPIEQAGAP